MALRPTVSASTRAIFRYDGPSISCHHQNPLIHSIRASMATPTQNSASIAYPQCPNRYLSHSAPSSSQAAAAAPAPEPERNQDEEQPQRTSQQQRNRGSPEVLSDVNGLLDDIGLASPSRKRGGASWRAMDRSVGSDVQDIFSQRASLHGGNKGMHDSLRDIAGFPTYPAKGAGADLPLSPTLGRSIPVRQGDVRGALSALGVRLAKNKVRVDSRNQKTHIRPGMKRKELKRMRWRKLFKESFHATVSRCQKLTKQGW